MPIYFLADDGNDDLDLLVKETLQLLEETFILEYSMTRVMNRERSYSCEIEIILKDSTASSHLRTLHMGNNARRP